jgi:hypothetical protein
MKFTIAAITLACAFAAEDATPPVISLDLSAVHINTNDAYGVNRANVQIKASSSASSKSAMGTDGASQFARKCAVGITDGPTSCPSPTAVAYDHHDTSLTDQITVGCTQYVTSPPGEKPYKSSTACTVADKKLASAEYAKRGEFVLTYDVSDSSNNAAEQLIFAMVMIDEEAPTIAPTTPFTDNQVEACLPANYVSGNDRCTGLGISATANDNYDTTLQAFTADGNAYTGGASVSINIRTLGVKTVTFQATDFADIFGTNNSDNVATATVSTTVVDTTQPRVSLRNMAAAVVANTNACSSTVVAGVTTLTECAEYNAKNVISTNSNAACAGCTSTACYTAGSSACAAVATTTSKWECGVDIPADDVVFQGGAASGVALATGAICVDDRLSADSDGLLNTLTGVAATITTTGTLNTAAAHGTSITVTYGCSDTVTTDVSITRTVTIQDTTAPSLYITRQGLRTAVANNPDNYWTHSGDTKESEVAPGTRTKDTTDADNDEYDANDNLKDMCEETNSAGCVDNDLETVYHSAGYTQDYKYIQALVAQDSNRKGYFCTDTCVTSSSTLNAAYDSTTGVGVQISWYKCGEGATTCCNSDNSDKASNAESTDDFDTLAKDTFAIVYECHDGQQSTKKCRTIVNQDHAKPVISILEGDNLEYEASSVSNYVDAGATCWDEVDGNISEDVEVSGDVVNLARVGVYMIMYDCSDSSGNAATQATRTVTVSDKTCPTCTFQNAADQDIILEASFPFTDPAFGSSPDVVCTDELNTNLTPTATYTKADGTESSESTITDATGTYYVTYIVTDDVGNTNEVSGDNDNKGKVAGDANSKCLFQTLSTAATADHSATLATLAYAASDYTRTITVKDTLKPVIKLKYGNSIIKSGAADNFGHQHPTETGYNHQTVAAQPATETDNSHLYVKGSFMAEESQESVNGWVLGAIASAVSGLALLGYSLRKQAQPVATSVPV